MALSMGLAPTLFPQTTGCFAIQLRERNGLPSRSSASEGWWEVLVTLQFVAFDTLFSDSRFTVGRPDHLPCNDKECRRQREE